MVFVAENHDGSIAGFAMLRRDSVVFHVTDVERLWAQQDVNCTR